MAGKFASVKFPEGFVEDARTEAAHMQRSVAGQIEHWARLGRMAEQVLTVDGVRRLRQAEAGFDDLAADARDTLLDDIFSTAAPASPEATAFFALRRAAGRGAGLDEQGRLARAMPGGGSEPVPATARRRRRAPAA